MKLFNREPAALLAFVAVAIKLLAAFGVGLSADQQAVLNAVAAAGVGLAVGFGLHWSADQQAVVLSFVQVAIAMFVRTQVTARVPAPAISRPTAV